MKEIEEYFTKNLYHVCVFTLSYKYVKWKRKIPKWPT